MRFSAKFNACVLAISLLGAMPLAAHAAGFGRISVKSNLGEPFRAEVDLLSVADGESVKVQFASMDTYQARQVEYPYFMSGMRISLQKRANGQPYALITSGQSINEPVVDLLLELKSDNGTVSRQYTSLLDPVEYQSSASTREEVIAAPVVNAPVSRPVARSKPASSTPPKVKTKKARTPSATPSAQGNAGSYTVQQGDTLMQVARLHRPEGVSLDKMVKALYQYNKGSFVGGNINRLRTGTNLNIPATVNGIQTVKAENFEAYQAEVAQKAQAEVKKPASVEPTTSPKASGTVNKVKTSVSKPTPAAKDVVKLTPPAQTVNAAPAVGKAPVAGGTAPSDASKVTDAAGVKLNNAALAASAAKPAVAVVASAPKVASSAPVAASAVVKAPVASAASATVAANKAKSASGAAPARVVDDSSIFDNPLVPAGGVAALLGIGALAFFMSRKKKEKAVGNFEDSILTGANLSPNTVLGAGGGVVDTAAASKPASTLGEHSFLTDFSREGLGNIDTDEVDPIAESEVYLAYGRADQAEEILKDALAKDGSRHDVRAKLLEIYAINKDKTAFASEALVLQQGVGAHHSLWNTVAQLGRTIDPDNALYQVSAPAAAFDAPVTAPEPVTTAHDLDFDLDAVPESAEVVFGAEAVEEKATALDFDFEAPAAASTIAPSAALADNLAALDLNLDSAPETKVEVEPDYDTSSIFGDDDFEEDDTPSLIDPVDTKLDLASAYMTMDDKDSAKEILEEVLAEGNPAQKAAAQQLLAKL